MSVPATKKAFVGRLMKAAPRFAVVELSVRLFGDWSMFDAIYRVGLKNLPEQISRKILGIPAGDKLASINADTPLGASWLWRFETMLSRLIGLIDETQGEISLVEYGSGAALLSLMAMNARPDRNITLTAIDINKHALRYARKYARKLGLGECVKTVVADASRYNRQHNGRHTICISQGLLGVYFGQIVRDAFLKSAAEDGCALVIDFMKGGTELCISSEAMGFPVANTDDDFGLHYATAEYVGSLTSERFSRTKIDDGEFSIVLTGYGKSQMI
jgi:hypothetical protein